MDARCIAADERMPAGKRLAMRHPPIAARVGQPAHVMHILGRDLDAIGHVRLPVCVIRAAVRIEAQIAAGHVAEGNFVCILVLHANLAAQATAIADRLPLLGRHLTKRLLQEGRLGTFHGGRLAQPQSN